MNKKLKIIVGSTRQGRIGKPIADQLVSEAKNNGIDIELLDIAEYNLPFFDAAVPPAGSPPTVVQAKKWATDVGDTDAFVFLTPEYNGSIPAPLKNAIDFLNDEWKDKSAVVVSYGFSGGKSASKHLSDILTRIGMDVFEAPVELKLGRDTFDETGKIRDIDEFVSQSEDTYKKAVLGLVEKLKIKEIEYERM